MYTFWDREMLRIFNWRRTIDSPWTPFRRVKWNSESRQRVENDPRSFIATTWSKKREKHREEDRRFPPGCVRHYVEVSSSVFQPFCPQSLFSAGTPRKEGEERRNPRLPEKRDHLSAPDSVKSCFTVDHVMTLYGNGATEPFRASWIGEPEVNEGQ